MADNNCPVNAVNCVSLSRVEALERALELEKEGRTRSNEKIYDRLGELERGMAAVTTQYANITDRLSTISADLGALKERPGRRWEAVVAALITGAVGLLLARFGVAG